MPTDTRPVLNSRNRGQFYGKTNSEDLKSGYVEKTREETRICLEKSFETVWEEPHDTYKSAKYPHRKTLVFSESKITIEYDDTPGNETIHIFHPSGSYMEINKNGDYIIHSENERYEITKKDKKETVFGNEYKTIRKNKEERIQGKRSFIIESDNLEHFLENDVHVVVGFRDYLIDGYWKNWVNKYVKYNIGEYMEFNVLLHWKAIIGTTTLFDTVEKQEFYAPITFIGNKFSAFGGVCTTIHHCRYSGHGHPGSSTVFASK